MDSKAVSDSLKQSLARASMKVSEDSDRFKFNTAVAALMILVNELEALKTVPKIALTQLVTMLAPFAPHLAEHLWEKLGGEGSPSTSLRTSVHQQLWPSASVTAASEVEVVVQVRSEEHTSEIQSHVKI